MLKSILFALAVLLAISANAQPDTAQKLTERQEAIIRISALTGTGDLSKLKNELTAGLEVGLTINQIKEVLVHVYAYAGFPRSIRGLQTFMAVLDERKANGIIDRAGAEASRIKTDSSKYERGKAILQQLTGVVEKGPKTGYAAFAPVIEIFLKEHLFADIFERDVLTYAERELVTIAVLSSLRGLEPMLRSHLIICLNLGFSSDQLTQFVQVIKTSFGRKQSRSAGKVLFEVLNSRTKVLPN